jgi:hypothetical protein
MPVTTFSQAVKLRTSWRSVPVIGFFLEGHVVPKCFQPEMAVSVVRYWTEARSLSR